MKFTERVSFQSPPSEVRRAIRSYLSKRFPRAADAIHWDSGGRRASGSGMGASGTLTLSGKGPTVVEIDASVGLPASLVVTEEKVRRYLRQALAEIHKSVP
jgi:hypothetical protein